MPDLPAMLNLAGRRCVIVGGGGVAVRRADSLLTCGAKLTVVAPRIDDRLKSSGAELIERDYETGDLDDAFVVIIATDRRAVNDTVHADARAAGVLVNRADDPPAGDFAVPAHSTDGPLTIAVHTGGVSPAAAAAIRREISAAVDPHWPQLLEIAAPWRKRVLREIDSETARRCILTKLADSDALALLKTEGPSAVQTRCSNLLSAPGAAPGPESRDTKESA